MKRFEEYQKYVKYPKLVQKVFKWYCYNNGQAFGPYDSRGECPHELVERVCINAKEVAEIRKARREAEREAFNLWYNELWSEYSHLPDKVFTLCYHRAYEEGHSSGYDIVAECMPDVVEFAEEIMKITKENSI